MLQKRCSTRLSQGTKLRDECLIFVSLSRGLSRSRKLLVQLGDCICVDARALCVVIHSHEKLEFCCTRYNYLDSII